jgi:glycosyltransferase involved in cell wall biosynthesis
MKQNFFFYITETSLPSQSANIINSLKFCEALSKFRKIIFLLPQKNLSKNEIFYRYDIKSKNFLFKSLINQQIDSKKQKLFFLIKVIKYFKKNNNINNLILSRSILSSILLAFLNIKNILEIHHDLTGYSKLLFNILIKTKYKKNISFVLINKNLVNDLNITKLNYIILDDAADNKIIKKNKVNHLKACVYIGSFYKGKGFEVIKNISKILPNVDFHLYGDTSVIKDDQLKDVGNNIKFMGKVEYRNVSKILSNYHIALMPYEKKISGKSSNLEISRYISPLKMFDYLSSGNIIIASKLKAYNHILKNDFNSFLLDSSRIKSWAKLINEILANPKKYKKIKLEAVKTAKKYSWKNRARLFFYFINEKKNI